MKLSRFLLTALFAFTLSTLGGCGTSGSGTVTYDESDMPATVPVQFQGWWKGKTEWDHLYLAPDGMMRVVFPKDFGAPFHPDLTTPSASSFLRIFRKQGDTLYAISKEQRFDRATGMWRAPVYYYVRLHYDFTGHELVYEQFPCGLNEDDMEKSADVHIARLGRACTISEEQAGQKTWKRTTSYIREVVPTGSATR